MKKNEFEHLIVTHDSGVMVITLNRPKAMNTINTTTIREILQALNSAKTKTLKLSGQKKLKVDSKLSKKAN